MSQDLPARDNPAAPESLPDEGAAAGRIPTGLLVIGRLVGLLLLVVGLSMAVCLAGSLFYSDWGATRALGLAVACTVGSGVALFYACRGGRAQVYRREALAVVSMGWLLIVAYSALPFVFAGTFANPVDAFFEATSGFTATGATVLTDIEAVPRGLLLWRQMTHWLGGMGIIVLFTALFAQLGVGAKQLFRTETPGPISESLHPKIKETALAVWKIYIGFTVLVFVLLLLCGMGAFDALCHAMSTMATGGYSTRNASVGHFDSVAVDLVITLFMFMGGVNFFLYYQALHGRWRALVRNGEFLTYLGLCAAVALAIAWDIYGSRHPDFAQALRYSAFQTVAVATTTGFCTDDFDAYPALSRTLLVCLMFVGGCAGSTSGGMKVSRLMVIGKIAYQEIYRVLRPQVRTSVRIGRQVVGQDVCHSIMVFALTFILFWAGGTVYMAALGLDLVTATVSVVACLGNVGPGLGQIGPTRTYAELPDGGKVFLSFCMLLGRLELSTLLVLLLPDFWRRVVRR